MKKNIIMAGLLTLLSMSVQSQQYTGLTGLIHTPSAEMNFEGNVRIGTHYMDKHFTPDAFDFQGKYNTADYYLSITHFHGQKWLIPARCRRTIGGIAMLISSVTRVAIITRTAIFPSKYDLSKKASGGRR